MVGVKEFIGRDGWCEEWGEDQNQNRAEAAADGEDQCQCGASEGIACALAKISVRVRVRIRIRVRVRIRFGADQRVSANQSRSSLRRHRTSFYPYAMGLMNCDDPGIAPGPHPVANCVNYIGDLLNPQTLPLYYSSYVKWGLSGGSQGRRREIA